MLRTETVKDFILSLGSKKGVRPGDLKSEAEKALLGTSILTRYNNKTYKIDELDFESSPKSTFTNEKGEQVSFIDYYKKQYGITIKDPDQPMIIHRARRTAVSEEETVKLICLVPELCMLTGMSEVMRSDFKVFFKFKKIEVVFFWKINSFSFCRSCRRSPGTPGSPRSNGRTT